MKKILRIIFFVNLGMTGSACISKEKDYSNWGIAIGIVTKVWEFDGSDITYEYVVSGNKYSNNIGSPIGSTFGDKYIVLYNPENPSESIIGDASPYFSKDDLTDTTEGEITSSKVTTTKYKDKVCFYFSFKYYVNGHCYTRDQNTALCTNSDIVLKKGGKYKVRYALTRPQSALLIISNTAKIAIRELPCEKQP